MKFAKYCTNIIEYSFYSLIVLVPLVFSGSTSELFEFNKMWLTFGVTAIIGGAWASKMALEKKFFVQRTPLDIPIMLFLLSQVISTLASLDPHVSWWGYYSRFNGGLLSTICYILLYYAFVSNLKLKHVLISLKVTLVAGILTALWGFPSHFGYDPTCLVFRGELNTGCWTEAFKPTIRTFSTLGQPAWFAAYLAMLIPLAVAYALQHTKVKFWSYFALAIFFYISLIFTDTRAGFIGFWVANALFWGALYIRKIAPKHLFMKAFATFNLTFLLCSFLLGSPIGSLNKFTLPHMMNNQAAKPEATAPAANAEQAQPVAAAPAQNITDSGDIRLLVWNGAIEAWKHNPVFGTGVETFAFAYYKYKSPEHNLTSEWDYLYNKAHNEYLNYLTTTGIFGLGTYLAFIGLFLFITTRHLIRNSRHNAAAHEKHAVEANPNDLLIISLLAGFVSILVTNFFGFSVVIINFYLFLIPIFIFIMGNYLRENHTLEYVFSDEKTKDVSPMQWTAITVFVIISGWMIVGLTIYHSADVAYALGSNLDKTGNFGEANPQLINAYQTVKSEPVYKDELSINLAAIAANLYAQKNNQAAQAAEQAIQMSTEVVTDHPNNVVYWKNRVRLFYTLAASDQANAGKYFGQAIMAIDKAKELAPTDAKIAYNQGILYGQTGQYDKAVKMLEDTVKLKPDYRDAYVALGLFYHEQAIDKDDHVVKPELQKKAIDTYQHVLDKLSPNDDEIKKSLKEWQTSK